MKKYFTFDDVCLVPSFSNLTSRLEPDTSTWITKDLKIKLPIVNSPMDSVISYELANILLDLGTYPIFNRFKNFEDYVTLHENYSNNVFISTGVQDLDYTKRIIDLGFDKLLLDTANGWTRTMLDFIYSLKKYSNSLQIMAGNVSTSVGYVDLINAGADSIRVGIGNGSPCTTRMVTAVGLPTFSVLCECAEMAKKYKVPFLCDGGIRNSRDLSLAVAAGATACMIGKLLALTEESAAQKEYITYFNGAPRVVKKCANGSFCGTSGRTLNYCARYRGQASEEYQLQNYGKVKEGTVPEGVGFWAPVAGPAKTVVGDLVAGLRSSMTYLGAKNIKEYQQKAEFVEVTPSYMVESKPRPE
jgi:IMP dehydrogenase